MVKKKNSNKSRTHRQHRQNILRFCTRSQHWPFPDYLTIMVPGKVENRTKQKQEISEENY